MYDDDDDDVARLRGGRARARAERAGSNAAAG
jgi:hypothetical protein